MWPDSHSIWLIEDIPRPASAMQVACGADLADYLEWPTLNGRIVAWAQNGESIVHDRGVPGRRPARRDRLGVGHGGRPHPRAGGGRPTTPDTGARDWFVVADTWSLPVLP